MTLRRAGSLIVLTAVACAKAPAPVTPSSSGRVTAPASTTGASPAALAQVLLCEEIALTLDPADAPGRIISLEAYGAEGGGGVAISSGAFTRVVGQILGESQRGRIDYRFQGDALVCAVEVHTSALTVLGSAPAEERPPSFWRADVVVFGPDGTVVHRSVDEVPGPDEFHREPAEIVAMSQALLALARAAADGAASP